MKWTLLIAICLLSFSCATSSSNKKRGETFFSHGTSSLLQKQYTEALDFLLKSHELLPNDTRVNTNLGMAYYFKNEMTKAEYHLRRAIELDPKNSDAKNNMASLYFQQKKYNDAEALYLMVLKDLTYEHQYRTFYNLGSIEMVRRNEAKALGYFERSVQENDSYCPAHFQLGEYAFRHQNYEDALKHYRNAQTGTCFNEPTSHLAEAKAMIRLRQYSKARIKVKDILNRFSDSPTEKGARLLMGQIEKEGQRQQFIPEESDNPADREISAPQF